MQHLLGEYTQEVFCYQRLRIACKLYPGLSSA
jgi:hypothetical protein